MKKHVFRIGTLALLMTGLALAPRTTTAQDNILSLIAGDYILDLGERTLPFKVLLIDGKLSLDAHVPGQDPQPMTPVAGKDLTFMSRDPRGNDIVLAFIKSAEGKITGCNVIVTSLDIEATATRVEKKAG